MKIVCNGLSYKAEITGTGEPLLLLHGFTGNLHAWDFLLSMLPGFQLIRIDIPGQGETEDTEDLSRYTMESISADLRELLQQLGLNRAHVLGYSMGGRLALSFAAAYPEMVQSLILESSSPGLDDEQSREQRVEQDTRLAERIQRDGIEPFVDYWENIALFESQKALPAGKRAAIRTQRLQNSPEGLAKSLLGMGTGAQRPLWRELGTFDFPVLLLTGELDKKFCRIASQMKQRLKKCSWQILNETGHAIHSEDEKKFGKIVYEFLVQHKRRSQHGN